MHPTTKSKESVATPIVSTTNHTREKTVKP